MFFRVPPRGSNPITQFGLCYNSTKRRAWESLPPLQDDPASGGPSATTVVFPPGDYRNCQSPPCTNAVKRGMMAYAGAGPNSRTVQV